MIYAGIDAGSRAIKAALYDEERDEIAATASTDQGIAQEELARALYERLLADAGVTEDKVARTVATGYGRNLVGFADTTITEITCHAAGVARLMPEVRTVVEIGGQDSKLIRLDDRGAVRDFAMNDRCAAGTGRFLEVVAERLEVPTAELGLHAKKSGRPATISSMCVVFAETEIVGLLAAGEAPANIIAGVQESIAKRVGAMAGRNVETPVVFTGGVAEISGMVDALESALKKPVQLAPQPRMTGAIGAALLAAKR